jgi:ATP-dependent DNA helicase RecG
MTSKLQYFSSRDVGDWNGGKKRESRNALAILNDACNLLGKPWCGSLRNSGKNFEHLGDSFEHLPNSSEHLNFEQIKVIWQIVGIKWLSLQTLAGLLGRETDTLRNHYINPMLIDGRLQAKVPDKPNHPGQAYRRTSS